MKLSLSQFAGPKWQCSESWARQTWDRLGCRGFQCACWIWAASYEWPLGCMGSVQWWWYVGEANFRVVLHFEALGGEEGYGGLGTKRVRSRTLAQPWILAAWSMREEGWGCITVIAAGQCRLTSDGHLGDRRRRITWTGLGRCMSSEGGPFWYKLLVEVVSLSRQPVIHPLRHAESHQVRQKSQQERGERWLKREAMIVSLS